MTTEPSTEPENCEKHVRITSGGKIKTWVANSLNFLGEEDENRTVILHTLPSNIEPTLERSTETGSQSIEYQVASNVLHTTPRLVSVAEIIKREYVKVLKNKSSKRMVGLHQYNEVGTLEQLGILVNPRTADASESPEKLRSKLILDAMRGKNHPRQTQSPYMRITLSTVEHPDLVAKGATYQPPQRRVISKSAKARAKKREKKAVDERDSTATIETPSHYIGYV